MNNTEPWKKYVPETVSLYHVDYRENLDEREDLQEQCIRNNNMGQGRRIIFFTTFSFSVSLLYYWLLLYYHLFMSIIFLIFIRYIKT